MVESSVGHIRDLPERASEIPKEKRAKYGTLGVAIDEGFEPYYVVDPDKKRIVADLKRKLKDADELLLATDEDREGEAIAWHLLQELRPKVPVRRMVFHEITQAGDRAGPRGHARGRRAPRRLAGDPAHSRPSVRLRGVPGALEEGHAQALGRTRAVGCDAARGRARAGAPALRFRLVLGPRGRLRSRLVPRPARAARRQARRTGPRLRPRRAAEIRCRETRRAGGAQPGGGAPRGGLLRPVGRREALLPAAVAAVHDLDAAAGGEPQAPLHGADDHARRATALRAWLHHLHAHRLDVALGGRADGRATPGDRALRRRVRSAGAASLRPAGQERPGGARGDPTGGRPLSRACGGQRRARSRRARPVRADLAPDARLTDGGREGPDGLDSYRRCLHRRPRRRVRRLRHRDHGPRVSRRLRGGARRGGRRGRRADASGPPAGRTPSSCSSSRRRATRRRRRRGSPRRRW